MNRFLSGLVTVWLLAACEEPAVPPAPIVVEAATCESAIGGSFALPAETAVEAAPGYDERLAALDLSALPAKLPMDEVGPLHRTLIAYMLETERAGLPAALDRDALASSGPLGRAILVAFAEGYAFGWTSPDLDLLRRGLHRFYACSRAHPTTLEGFRASIYDPTGLAPHELDSSVKNERRRLREDPAAGVFVSETVVDGQVRETEIILAGHRPDGALDFLVYDATGRLMDRSRFITEDGVDISGAAPYVCITCHLNPATFEVTMPYPGVFGAAATERRGSSR